MSNLVKKGNRRNLPKTIPRPTETANSKNKITKNKTSVASSLMSAFAMDKQMANKMITKTSFITVTPITVLVKGPLALISLMTAMADEGERATKMTANKTETAILWLDGIFA